MLPLHFVAILCALLPGRGLGRELTEGIAGLSIEPAASGGKGSTRTLLNANGAVDVHPSMPKLTLQGRCGANFEAANATCGTICTFDGSAVCPANAKCFQNLPNSCLPEVSAASSGLYLASASVAFPALTTDEVNVIPPVCDKPMVGILPGNIRTIGMGVNSRAINPLSFDLKDATAMAPSARTGFVLAIGYYATDAVCNTIPSRGPRQFIEPPGVSVSPTDICLSTFDSSSVTTVEKYAEQLDTAVSVSGSTKGLSARGGFQASTSFTSTSAYMREEQRSTYLSTSLCTIYSAKLVNDRVDRFDGNFKAAVRDLPDTFSSTDKNNVARFLTFLSEYGDSVIIAATMGSRQGTQVLLTRSLESSLRKNGTSISASVQAQARYSVFTFSGKSGTELTSLEEARNKIQNDDARTLSISVGPRPRPPRGGAEGGWDTDLINESPYPVISEIMPLDEIMLAKQYGAPEELRAKAPAVKTAIAYFCAQDIGQAACKGQLAQSTSTQYKVEFEAIYVTDTAADAGRYEEWRLTVETSGEKREVNFDVRDNYEGVSPGKRVEPSPPMPPQTISQCCYSDGCRDGNRMFKVSGYEDDGSSSNDRIPTLEVKWKIDSAGALVVTPYTGSQSFKPLSSYSDEDGVLYLDVLGTVQRFSFKTAPGGSRQYRAVFRVVRLNNKPRSSGCGY